MLASTEAALLAAIYADPANDAPRAVYADFLIEKGKPLGEFIALQLARAQGKRGTKGREEALLAQHGHTFWPGHPGALGHVPRLANVDRGFPSCAFNVIGSDTPKRAAKLAGAPGWATIRTLLTVGEWSSTVYRKILASNLPILDSIQGITPKMLAAVGDELTRLPSLRQLFVRAFIGEAPAIVEMLPKVVRARLVGKPTKTEGGLIRLRLEPAARRVVKPAKPVTISKSAPKPPPSAFWEELLAAERSSDAERHLARTADKTVGKLPRELPAALVERIYGYYVAERPYALWHALARIDDAHVTPLLSALERSDDTYEGHLVVAAHRAGGADGIRAVGAFADFIRKSTNLPGLYKRLPRLAVASALVDAIEEAVTRFAAAKDEGPPLLPYFASVFVLARARPRSKAFAVLTAKCRTWGQTEALARARSAAR